MSSVKPATPATAPKAMSSRLLTMKFMQRAAATSPSSNSPPAPLNEPSPKRQKTSHNNTPTKASIDALADNRAIRAALEEEENKRQAALDRQAAELGDTRWVLSFEGQNGATPPKSLRVVQAGFANLDIPSPLHTQLDEDEDLPFEDKPAVVGRRSFGKFNRVLERQQELPQEQPSESDSEGEASSESEDSDDSDDDPLGTKELIRASRQEAAKHAKDEREARKKAQRAESAKMAKERQKKTISLNGPVSLKGLTSLTGRQDTNIQCHRCGGPHMIRNCDQPGDGKRRFQGKDDGPPRKARRSK